MKLSDIVDAAPALQKMITQDLPLHMACNVADLVTLCNVQLLFYGNQVERIKKEDGNTEERHAELLSIDADGFEDYEPLRLPKRLPLHLSSADVKCLEPLITFCEDNVLL